MSQRYKTICVLVLLGFLGAPVQADLSSHFDGFQTVSEVGVSGLKSSYYTPVKNGNYVPNFLQALGPDRVKYAVGTLPSPGYHGGGLGRYFDEGILGVKLLGGNLVVQVAGGLNPLTGYYYSGYNTWYGQGDVFVTVSDSSGISHFALLNSWARDGSGNPRTIDGSHFDAAQSFHVGGGAGGAGLEGHLIGLTSSSQVVLTGGKGSHAWSGGAAKPPGGLDVRAYAIDGSDLGDANISHTSTTDLGLGGVSQNWYIQTWTLPVNWLSSDSTFTLGLHKTTSCGNDQIGGNFVVPAPAAVVLGLVGLCIVGCVRRRLA